MNLLLEFACILGFGAACWAGGDLLRKLFSAEPSPIVARHTLAFTVGNVAFSYFLTALGFLGLYTSWVLKAVFLAGIGLVVLNILVTQGASCAKLVKKFLPHRKGVLTP